MIPPRQHLRYNPRDGASRRLIGFEDDVHGRPWGYVAGGGDGHFPFFLFLPTLYLIAGLKIEIGLDYV